MRKYCPCSAEILHNASLFAANRTSLLRISGFYVTVHIKHGYRTFIEGVLTATKLILWKSDVLIRPSFFIVYSCFIFLFLCRPT